MDGEAVVIGADLLEEKAKSPLLPVDEEAIMIGALSYGHDKSHSEVRE